MSEKLFSEFPYTTSKQWLAQIAKDLKGRSFAEMQWSPDGDILINPYIHAEDVPVSMPEIPSFGKWQIGESFVVTDAKESNRQILEALRGGVESLRITCEDTVKWEHLFADVELPIVHIGLEIRGDIHLALKAFNAYAGTKHKPDAIAISIYLPNHELTVLLAKEFPYYRFCNNPASFDSIAEGLVSIIYNILVSSAWNPEQLSKFDLTVSVGMHSLVEIARLRALRILWTNLASSLNFSLSPAFAIKTHTKECAKDDDPYTHMIRSTVMGLAAVLGGADRIYIQPSRGGNHTESFYRHIARNIHHLLRMESKFSEISDPIAGAYYLNKLTRDIVDKVWEMLPRRIKESGGKALLSG